MICNEDLLIFEPDPTFLALALASLGLALATRLLEELALATMDDPCLSESDSVGRVSIGRASRLVVVRGVIVCYDRVSRVDAHLWWKGGRRWKLIDRSLRRSMLKLVGIEWIVCGRGTCVISRLCVLNPIDHIHLSIAVVATVKRGAAAHGSADALIVKVIGTNLT